RSCSMPSASGGVELRIAVVCEGTPIAAWQARCLSALLGVAGVDLAAVVVVPTRPSPDHGQRGVLWSTFWSSRVVRRSRALRCEDVDDLLADVQRFDIDDDALAEALAPLDLDVVMQLS